MPISQTFVVSSEDMADPHRAADVLNEVLSRIADRLDALQGLRGDAEVQGTLIVTDEAGTELGGFLRRDPT